MPESPEALVMRCLSCGASHGDSDCCSESGNVASSSNERDFEQSESGVFDGNITPEASQTPNTRRKSTLIEFPGIVRSTVPDWRRELSERVREVQERKAREAALEASEAERAHAAQATTAPQPQLELLPQAAAPALNPLVAAALRRIERANRHALSSSAKHGSSAAAAIAYVTEDELESSPDEPSAISADTLDLKPLPSEPKALSPEKTHNLVVVSPPAPPPPKIEPKVIARRLISDNDPVLNYLDAIPTTLRVDEIHQKQAGVFSRLVSAFIDLLVVAVLFSPFMIVVELTNGDWHKLQTAVFAAVVASFVLFLYLTFATALTGRTLGMRALSLRTVDRRTGLIPTGAQSSGRALIYVASLLALGLPVLYTLLNREGYTAHDRLTRTMVIRA